MTLKKNHKHQQRYSQNKPDISMMLHLCPSCDVQSKMCKNILVVVLVVVVPKTEKNTDSKPEVDKFSLIRRTLSTTFPHIVIFSHYILDHSGLHFHQLLFRTQNLLCARKLIIVILPYCRSSYQKYLY